MHSSAFFEQAVPVWPEGLGTARNITIGLYAEAVCDGQPLRLRIATAGYYRVFADGIFIANGPARCAHGFFRVDTVALTVQPGQRHHIAVEIVNYAVNSFELPLQEGFVQAELLLGSRVLAATGREGFAAYRLTERVRRVPRFSFQRPFAEAYRLTPEAAGWRVGRPGASSQPVTPVPTAEKRLVPRRIAPFSYPTVRPERLLSRGTLHYPCPPAHYRRDRSMDASADGRLRGYPEEELSWNLSRELQDIRYDTPQPIGEAYTGSTQLSAGQYEVLSLPGEKTGYIACRIECRQPSTLWITVDERLTAEGLVDPLGMECLNAVALELQPGHYDFQAVEALGFAYLQLSCTAGAVEITELRLREAVCPYPVTAVYADPDPHRQRIFRAACETFRQNSMDLFTDCPTRERAGWLCDSWFTARAERALTGGNAIEYNFLENYLLAERFDHLPDGMVPMCYPADHFDGNFIPNWAMWLVLELEDYVRRTGDRALAEAFRPRLEALLTYFRAFENADGLLERLKGWVFVEWSHANDLVQDINFPTNMLYARMLQAMAFLYGDGALSDRAERLRETVRRRSFNGQFFTDNEVLRDGVPVSSGECTETCQYYAFFTGTATPERYPALWDTLCRDFGPQRSATGAYPQIAPSNAFIGNYLRLELLRLHGKTEQLRREIDGYFYTMACRTGTLWENMTDHASCCHGFASYVAALLLEN